MAEEDWSKGLPLDIMHRVAGGQDKMKAMRGVSQAWKEGYEGSVRRIRVSGTWGSTLPINFHALTSLDLGSSLAPETSLFLLSSLSKLVSLTLGCPFPDNHASPIATGALVSPNSRPLAWRLTGTGLGQLRTLPLTNLDLHHCSRLSSRDLLSIVAPLTTLSLVGCYKIETMRGLAAMLHLSTLDLSFCTAITNSGLSALQHIPLTSLNLSGCPLISDAGLANLSALTNLTHLNLARHPARPPAAGHAGQLGGSQITDAGLTFLRGLPLHRLILRDCSEISDTGLEQILKPPLSALNLSGCPGVSNALLWQLRKLPLTALGLAGCPQLTDGSLYTIRGLRLEFLDLSNNSGITDDGLLNLRFMSLRRGLLLMECPELTSDGITVLETVNTHARLFYR